MTKLTLLFLFPNVSRIDDVKDWRLLACIHFLCILTAVQSEINDVWDPTVWRKGLF